ncbi:cysteine desulfurase [Guyparkeria sp. SCN-R1]|uniref:aminotransferase class V-fold PLP-dependent enzyme n=1 Tax=Guyparkeria sp. SCN-R1 TaxID=2341113 RepID=UPI000F64E643|nr:cysteine desulfurase [Guyparkeria sp. SCN-R1]RRQ20253.1 cysteine desulfurase [Guyparkeria sp. SCN-R1]
MANDGRTQPFSVDAIRAQFPALDQEVHGKPLVYLDNAATTQKPRVVIDTIREFYERDNANIHRGVHTLSARASERFENARTRIACSLNADNDREIVFVRGVTEAINLLAHSLSDDWRAGDEVILSELEHHANIVPWLMLGQRKGIVIRTIPVNEQGELKVDALPDLISDRTRLVAVNHVSNALGTINPVARVGEIAHERDVPVLVDGAQGLPHGPVDVQALGCDFYACSSHKVFGPSGVGALYARGDWLDRLPPFMGGGDMIEEVRFDGVRFAPPPSKFEAGTPNIEGAIGFGAALEWADGLDWLAIERHEAALLERMTSGLTEIPGLRIVGQAAHKVPVVSFLVDGAHPHDIGTLLDSMGIAVRTGHHCAMPLMHCFDAPAGTARASAAFYNTLDEIDQFVAAVARVRDMLV